MGSGFMQRFQAKIKCARLFLATHDTITAAADGLIGDATLLDKQICRLSTVAGAADSVLLPLAMKGDFVIVINDGAAAAQVFASGTDTIDAIDGQATGVPLTNAKRCIYFAPADGVWVSLMGVKSA